MNTYTLAEHPHYPKGWLRQNLAAKLAPANDTRQAIHAPALCIGHNIANTPGTVVYRDEVFELLQYIPTTAVVHEIPVLIIPPQANKHYIFDLSQGRSFIAHAISQGLQVFCVSWRNPTAMHRHWNLDTYAMATKRALSVTRGICGSNSVNLASGYSGGTLTTAVAAEMMENGEGQRINSLTLLGAGLDSRACMLFKLLFNDRVFQSIKQFVQTRGFFDGNLTRLLGSGFPIRDLFRSLFPNNYLTCNTASAFELLYWDHDSNRLPANLHCEWMEILRSNLLVQAGGMKILDTPIDLQSITCKAYLTAGITDRSSPWDAYYFNTRLLGGEVRFVLSSSNHAQSLINPPGNRKAWFCTYPDYTLESDQWLERARRHQNSWWTDWSAWITAQSRSQRRAPQAPGCRYYPPLDTAPGRYVYQR